MANPEDECEDQFPMTSALRGKGPGPPHARLPCKGPPGEGTQVAASPAPVQESREAVCDLETEND